jgi:photosystem II stability/assembly factor-like uncharacterized protein
MLLAILYHVVIADSWILQNPSLAPIGLKDIDVINKENVFAVGANGTILQTTNSGTTWKINRTEGNWWLQSVVFFDRNNGWVAGGAKSLYLLQTKDGGLNWNNVNENAMPPGMKSLYADCIKFISNDIGFICGMNQSYSTAFRTIDGGKSWESCNLNEGELFDFYFLNGSNCFVCGENGYIGYTSDTGKTWIKSVISDTITTTPVNSWLFKKIVFLSNEIGYCLAHEEAVFKTENGGKTWFPILIEPVQTNSMVFKNENEGIVFVGWGPVMAYITRDGGKTWNKQVTSIAANVSDCQYIDQNQGICITINGAIYKFTGLLDTLFEVTQGTGGSLNSIDFINDTCGFAIGDNFLDSTVLTTQNGGQRWDKKRLSSSGANKIICFNENNAITVDYSGNIYKTSDNGISWKKIDYKVDSYISSLPMQGGRIGNCRQCAYLLSRDNSVHVSYDAGENWKKRSLPVQEGISSLIQIIYFLDTSTVWISDMYGKIYFSNDNGQSWKLQSTVISSSGEIKFTAMFFIDTLIGWIGGYTSSSRAPVLMKTIDGGKNWANQSTIAFIDKKDGISDQKVLKIYAKDINNAWAIYKGGVLSTIDGGVTWVDNVVENMGLGINDGVFMSPNNFWIAGVNSGIWKYSSHSIIQHVSDDNTVCKVNNVPRLSVKRAKIKIRTMGIVEKVEIYNSLGRKVFHKEYVDNHNNYIEIPNPHNLVRTGIYYVRLKTIDNNTYQAISIPFLNQQ